MDTARHVVLAFCVMIDDAAGRRRVVQMPVGEHDRLWNQIHRFEPLDDHLTRRARVDEDALFLSRRYDIRIGMHGTDDDAIDEHEDEPTIPLKGRQV